MERGSALDPCGDQDLGLVTEGSGDCIAKMLYFY